MKYYMKAKNSQGDVELPSKVTYSCNAFDPSFGVTIDHLSKTP